MKLFQFDLELNGKKEVKVICAPNKTKATEFINNLKKDFYLTKPTIKHGNN